MKKNMSKYYKFIIYLIIVVLVNIAGATLFFRIDLTRDSLYSLSDASRQVVSTLSEPLTIKVFFTKNLPAPHNNTEQYLNDLLSEYYIAGNKKYFNYQFYNVSTEETDEAVKNRKLAESYGIYPLQIQNIEQDEVKFLKAYMGMIIIHGDVLEKIPAITSTEGLEYKITSAIRKMNNKISALLNLEKKIQVDLYLSSSLSVVGPYMNLSGLSEVPKTIKSIVDQLNRKSYGQLSYKHQDPTIDYDTAKDADDLEILQLKWETFKDQTGKQVQGGNGYAGLIIRYEEKTESIPLLHVVRIPIFGTQYKLAESEELETAINNAMEAVIDINEAIGYLSKGTPPLFSFAMPGQKKPEALSNFNSILSRDYSVQMVEVSEKAVPEGISSLIIAGAKEKFTDFELFQIDQFLMKGKSLVVFMDAFNENMPQSQNRMMFNPNQGPMYTPRETGLKKMLQHYGIAVKHSYVLDENCFEQNIPSQYGGGKRSVYFVPIIKNERINHEVSFMKNIKGLVMLKASPVSILQDRVKAQKLRARYLFSSTDKSWELSKNINLNPMFMQAPSEDIKKESFPLACILEGSFKSYFADKTVPEKKSLKTEEDKKNGSNPKKTKKPAMGSGAVKAEGAVVKTGKPGQIFLVSTSEIIKDNVLDEKGETPNAHFVMNTIDYLNGRESFANMRSKSQSYNPLKPVSPGTRTFVKVFNVAGLPALVIISGLIVWFRRASKKRLIQSRFQK